MLERYDATWSLEKKKNHWQKIQSSADRIQDLLENVLRLGSADSGTLQFNPVKTDLKVLLEKIVEEAAASDRGAHPILLTVPEIDPVPLDQNFIEHILSNLLSNAIKYSPNQNAIQLRSIFQDNQIIFEVADGGIGIPAEDIPDLFEPFHRASNSGNVPGTGLGLTIVKRFVKLHGGTISVDSTINIGTTFTITIPLLSHYKL
jgi:signal transduction histidine kinase